jgi:hypothetical protein
MGSIAQMLQARLPLNRKEVYFTATVLPGIICTEGFAHFNLFLKLLGAPESAIQAAYSPTVNVQFFTEYCLAESIHGERTTSRFPNPPLSRERPDLMILIDGSEPLLIVIEAKLYDGTRKIDLIAEMDQQKKHVVGYLRGRWPELRTIHAALLPKAMKDEFSGPVGLGGLEEDLPSYKREMITWEKIRDAYAHVPSTAYFGEILRIAIEEYDDLKGERLAFGKYKDDSLLGSEILKRHEQGDLTFCMMGRRDGLSGSKLNSDIATGQWTNQRYEVKKSSEDRPNWFPISAFVNRVKTVGKN